MNLQQMKEAVDRRIDDVTSIADVVEYLNSAKDRMASAVEAKFPDLVASNLQGTFVFDTKYHEGPVAYAAAMFKKQDSATSESADFMAQFEDIKKEFTENYRVPPRYRDDARSQQFTATADQTTFSITRDNYSARYGDLKVYVNDRPVEFTKSGDWDFILVTAATAGDAVTAIWEEHADLAEPPHSWWTW